MVFSHVYINVYSSPLHLSDKFISVSMITLGEKRNPAGILDKCWWGAVSIFYPKEMSKEQLLSSRYATRDALEKSSGGEDYPQINFLAVRR